jgi:hypothetical protein
MKTMIMMIAAVLFATVSTVSVSNAATRCQPKGISTCEHGAKEGVTVPSKNSKGKGSKGSFSGKKG